MGCSQLLLDFGPTSLNINVSEDFHVMMRRDLEAHQTKHICSAAAFVLTRLAASLQSVSNSLSSVNYNQRG